VLRQVQTLDFSCSFGFTKSFAKSLNCWQNSVLGSCISWAKG